MPDPWYKTSCPVLALCGPSVAVTDIVIVSDWPGVILNVCIALAPPATATTLPFIVTFHVLYQLDTLTVSSTGLLFGALVNDTLVDQVVVSVGAILNV